MNATPSIERLAMTRANRVTATVVSALVLTGAPAIAEAAGTRILITASGMKSADGEVSCALYRSARGFPNKPELAASSVIARIDGGTAICVFDNVSPGPAAVSVYHDANDNKRLDLRFGIIPRESVGASNNPKARFGPPEYEAARFEVGGTLVALAVMLQQP